MRLPRPGAHWARPRETVSYRMRLPGQARGGHAGLARTRTSSDGCAVRCDRTPCIELGHFHLELADQVADGAAEMRQRQVQTEVERGRELGPVGDVRRLLAAG